MSTKFGPLGIDAGDCYRSIPESRIIEMLMLSGCAFELGTPRAAEIAGKALQSWTQMGLGFTRATNGERLFDPVEVTNFMKRAGIDEEDDFLGSRVVSTHRRLVTESMRTEAHGRGTHAGERRFVVDFKRTFNLRSAAPTNKLRLRAPLPLAGDYLTGLDVKPFAQGAGAAEINLSPGRMELRMIAAGEAEAVLGAELSFTARLQEPLKDQNLAFASDLETYLSTREGLIVVTERVRALARSLAGIDACFDDAVRAFWTYINGDLMCGYLHYDQIDFAMPCDWILDSGWFDCQLGSALFVALCRAQGIPARLVGGYLLYEAAPASHYWAEAWSASQGWTPFDFLSWDLSMGGRDIPWRDHFFGRLDYRFTCQRMPKEFIGAPGVPIPPAWCLLQVPAPGGAEIGLLDINGTTVYADTVRVASGSQA